MSSHTSVHDDFSGATLIPAQSERVVLLGRPSRCGFHSFLVAVATILAFIIIILSVILGFVAARKQSSVYIPPYSTNILPYCPLENVSSLFPASPDIWIANRASLVAALSTLVTVSPNDRILVFGNIHEASSTGDSDTTTLFRQNSPFTYSTGIPVPDAAVVIAATGTPPVTALFISSIDSVWVGEDLSLQEWATLYGAADAYVASSLSSFLTSYSTSTPNATLHVLSGRGPGPWGAGLGAPVWPVDPNLTEASWVGQVNTTALSAAFDLSRLRKTPLEITAIRAASIVTSAAHELVMAITARTVRAARGLPTPTPAPLPPNDASRSSSSLIGTAMVRRSQQPRNRNSSFSPFLPLSTGGDLSSAARRVRRRASVEPHLADVDDVGATPHFTTANRPRIPISTTARRGFSIPSPASAVAALTEGSVEALFLSSLDSCGLRTAPYVPIVAGGYHGAILHYTANNAPLPVSGKSGRIASRAGRKVSMSESIQRSARGSEQGSGGRGALKTNSERVKHNDASVVATTLSSFTLSDDGDGLLLLDAAGEHNRYASDVTRTWPVSGVWSDAQKTIYNIVLNAQSAAESACRAGVMWSNVTSAAQSKLVMGLEAAGLVNRSAVGYVQSIVAGLFMPHGLGHTIGLDTHDQPSIPTRTPLVEDIVLTIEPGVYFNKALFTDATLLTPGIIATAVRPFLDSDFGGVRIEDVYVIRNESCERLSTAVRTVAEIEAIQSR